MDYIDFHGYKVYRDGRIIGQKGKELKPINWGYAYVFLYENGIKKKYFLHRILATCFIPNPENKTQVNHINGNKQDNRLENLEWCTSSENIRHAWKTGLAHHHKLTDAEVAYMRIIYSSPMRKRNYAHFSRLLDVDQSTIRRAVTGKTWKT